MDHSDLQVIYMDTGNLGHIYVSLCIHVGSLDDKGLPGISHFLEHALIEIIRSCCNTNHYQVSGRTSFSSTAFTLEVQSQSNLGHALSLLNEIYLGQNLSNIDVNLVRDEIADEYSRINQIQNEIASKLLSLRFQNNLPIGSISTINQISVNELMMHHERYYNSMRNPFVFAIGSVKPCSFPQEPLVFQSSDEFNKYRGIAATAQTQDCKFFYAKAVSENCIICWSRLQNHCRVETFIGFAILERLLSQFYLRVYKTKVDVQCTAINYAIGVSYVKITMECSHGIRIPNAQLRGYFKNYLFSRLDHELLLNCICEQRSNLSCGHPPNKMILESVIESYMYGCPTYSISDYLHSLERISLDELEKEVLNITKYF